MSKADIVNKFKNPNKLTAADKLYGNEEDNVINETAATNEESENNVDLEAAIAKAYADENDAPKPKKTLKGVYIDDDVLEVYEAVAAYKGRGWGSQKISDLLRAEFIKEGLMKR